MNSEASDQAAIQSSLARLQHSTTPSERFEILEKLVAYWHAPIRPEDGMRAENLDRGCLPPPLRKWFRWAGHRREIMSGQNFLLYPAEMTLKDGFLTFYKENQGVYEWATLCEGDDPPVFGRFEVSDPWQPEGITVSEHLILMCLFESISSARHSASIGWLDAHKLRRIREAMPVSLPAWRWPAPGNFYVGRGTFMLACEYGSGAETGYSLWIGAKESGPLAFLKPIVDETWDHIAL